LYGFYDLLFFSGCKKLLPAKKWDVQSRKFIVYEKERRPVKPQAAGPLFT